MAVERMQAGRTSPVVQLRKWLLPVRRVQEWQPLQILAWPAQSTPAPWLTLQNAVWQHESARATSWDEAWFDREFSRLGQDQFIWTAHCVSTDSRVPIGAVSLDVHVQRGHEAVVNWLAVLPEFRRVGVGTALMACAEHEAWRRGRMLTRVETLTSWERAMSFYRQLGYR